MSTYYVPIADKKNFRKIFGECLYFRFYASLRLGIV